MKSISAGVKIWVKTVFLNAFFFGIGVLIAGDVTGVFMSIVVLFGGFFASLPLLMFIVPLVTLSTRLPYGIPARIAWLTFYLIVMIVLFYTLLEIADGNFLGIRLWGRQLMGTTIGGLLIAVITTRRSLTKLNT